MENTGVLKGKLSKEECNEFAEMITDFIKKHECRPHELISIMASMIGGKCAGVYEEEDSGKCYGLVLGDDNFIEAVFEGLDFISSTKGTVH